jgi:23S rRNA (cytosine1962-C5)-methyltransferase
MQDVPLERPTVTLLPGRHKRALGGHPWIYSNEIQMDASAKSLPSGGLVTLQSSDRRKLGVAAFNPHTLVAARLFDRDPSAAIDASFISARLVRALEIRERLYPEPHYRLVHAEADGLPGVVIDRYGAVVVLQLNTAGADRLESEMLSAIDAVLRPSAVVLRNDSAGRALEGLSSEVRLAQGTLAGETEARENGARFPIDPVGGQKTGWFYDQRENRRFMAALSRGARVLDLYCFGGGFAVEAALAGAAEALGLDRSEAALALAGRAAEMNGMAARCQFRRGEIFAELQAMLDRSERFDVVISDPPAFVRSRKDLGPGLRGYRKLARLAAGVTAPRGYLFLASCSHNVTPEDFAEAARQGLDDAERHGRIILSAGAAPDHPTHPALPESAYLKALVLALD